MKILGAGIVNSLRMMEWAEVLQHWGRVSDFGYRTAAIKYIPVLSTARSKRGFFMPYTWQQRRTDEATEMDPLTTSLAWRTTEKLHLTQTAIIYIMAEMNHNKYIYI